MPDAPVRRSTTHGLLFLILLSFVASFLAARIFATLNPNTVVVTGGIHLHHFWYGLAMVALAGGLGIAYIHPSYRRFYAVLFGLGGGLVGDEVGLLLTFGNYDSVLTLYFFVFAVTGGVLGLMIIRYRDKVEDDVISLGNGERLVYLGVVVTGLSALSFASGLFLPGTITALAGLAIVAGGFWWHRARKNRKRDQAGFSTMKTSDVP